jgi:hypothetical protein
MAQNRFAIFLSRHKNLRPQPERYAKFGLKFVKNNKNLQKGIEKIKKNIIITLNLIKGDVF